MRILVTLLKIVNFLLGAVLIIGGIGAYFLTGVQIPLFLALGLIAVGPLEDFLVRGLGQTGDAASLTRALIDQATSLALELFMLAAGLAAIFN
jgi:hypothetical protein